MGSTILLLNKVDVYGKKCEKKLCYNIKLQLSETSETKGWYMIMPQLSHL